MTRLTWSNLQRDLCPKCGCKLIHTPVGIKCETADLAEQWQCGFYISRKRFDEIRGSIAAGPVKDNQEDLNNL